MADPKKGVHYEVTWDGTAIPGLLNFSRTRNRGEVETTDFDSGDDKEFIPGESDQTFSLEFQHEPGDTDQEAAMADWEDGTQATLLLGPTATAVTGDRTWSAAAFATSISDTYAKEDIVAFTVDFRIDGAATIAITV